MIALAEQKFSDAGLYYGHGTDNPADEAAYLILRSLGLPFDASAKDLDEPLQPQLEARLLVLIERRVSERIPVAYLINEAWFAGLPFYVDQSVLVPRSPLAELIEERFNPWLHEAGVQRILDIGTGSGCIAIACAHAFPDAMIDANDIDTAVLAIASRNIERYQLSRRVHLYQANVFQGMPPARYDLILSNPPYVSTAEMGKLPAEYQQEPATALSAGMDGLDVVRTILRQAGSYLAEHGVLIVEVGNSQAAVMENFPGIPFTWLEFERGGEGVFLLTAADLKAHL